MATKRPEPLTSGRPELYRVRIINNSVRVRSFDCNAVPFLDHVLRFETFASWHGGSVRSSLGLLGGVASSAANHPLMHDQTCRHGRGLLVGLSSGWRTHIVDLCKPEIDVSLQMGSKQVNNPRMILLDNGSSMTRAVCNLAVR